MSDYAAVQLYCDTWQTTILGAMSLLTVSLFEAVGVDDSYLTDDRDPLDKHTAGSTGTFFGQRPET